MVMPPTLLVDTTSKHGVWIQSYRDNSQARGKIMSRGSCDVIILKQQKD